MKKFLIWIIVIVIVVAISVSYHKTGENENNNSFVNDYSGNIEQNDLFNEQGLISGDSDLTDSGDFVNNAIVENDDNNSKEEQKDDSTRNFGGSIRFI